VLKFVGQVESADNNDSKRPSPFPLVNGRTAKSFLATAKTDLFSVLAALVAQTCSLSVSVEIGASRDDFSERGCVRSASRSASEPPEIPVSLQPLVRSVEMSSAALTLRRWRVHCLSVSAVALPRPLRR